jgi:rfaE bifunctional protein kinase chain/domain
LVEEHGGRVLFSSGDVVYSSTHIIDSHKHELEPVAEQVTAFCGRHAIDEARVLALLDALTEKTVAVVGETIVDTYVYAEPLGMSAEAPVLVVRPRDSETFIGGAAIVAQHLGGLGATPRLVSVVGRDAAADRVRSDLAMRGIAAEFLEDGGRPTIVKTRYIAEGKKLLNVNVYSDHDLDHATEAALLERLEALADEIDAVVVTDFGYGIVTDRVVDWARALKQRRGVAVVGDVQCSTQLGNVRRMSGVTVIAPSEREARLSLCDRTSGIADLGAQLLLEGETDCVLVTLGARGMMLFELGEGVERAALANKNLAEVKAALSIEYLPSLAATPVDPMGAGDAMLATLAASLAAGASAPLAAFVAMGAAAVAASHLGNVAVTRAALKSALFPAARSE